jgi:hypothetical protein
LTALWNLLLSLSGWPAHLVLSGFAFAEAALFFGMVVPGETALFLGGVLAVQGRVSLPVMIAVAIAVAIVGDSVGYEIGRRTGPRLHRSRRSRRSRLGRMIGERRWRRAETAIGRNLGSGDRGHRLYRRCLVACRVELPRHGQLDIGRSADAHRRPRADDAMAAPPWQRDSSAGSAAGRSAGLTF